MPDPRAVQLAEQYINTPFASGEYRQGLVTLLEQYAEEKTSAKLALIETGRLIRELLNRHDHAAFVGKQLLEAKGQFLTRRKWKGDAHQVAGMAMEIGLIALEESAATERDAGSEHHAG